MDKITKIDNYIDTVKENSDFFKSYYYHSIVDLNLVKLDLILNNGILSKNLINQNKLVNLFTHPGYDLDSKNGNTHISLTQYTDDCGFYSPFHSFPQHTLISTSLLVNKNIDISRDGERQSFFDDEIFCLDSILPDKIEGILLPEHLSNKQISEVNCLPNHYTCYSRTYINNWIGCMERYFGEMVQREEIKTSFYQLWDILEKYDRPYEFIATGIKKQRGQYGKDLKDVLAENLQRLWSKKLKMDNPSYMDVILQINNNKLPVYEIKQKSLKRIV